jgi:hypothetical protein
VAAAAAPMSAQAARCTCNVNGTDAHNVTHHYIESGSSREQAKSKAMNQCHTLGRSQGVSGCEVKVCHQD